MTQDNTGFYYVPAKLPDIRVLWREPSTMELYGIPYNMRPGMSPDRIPEGSFRQSWIRLGSEQSWGALDQDQVTRIRDFLSKCKTPTAPNEWCRVTPPPKSEAVARPYVRICSPQPSPREYWRGIRPTCFRVIHAGNEHFACVRARHHSGACRRGADDRPLGTPFQEAERLYSHILPVRYTGTFTAPKIGRRVRRPLVYCERVIDCVICGVPPGSPCMHMSTGVPRTHPHGSRQSRAVKREAWVADIATFLILRGVTEPVDSAYRAAVRIFDTCPRLSQR